MNEIMTLPASVVITAAAEIKGLNSTDKAECAAALSALVESGHTSLAEIRAVVPVEKVDRVAAIALAMQVSIRLGINNLANEVSHQAHLVMVG
jgi:hypothetical protein